MMHSGIAIVDVPSLTILGTLATDGFVACGMIKPSANADHAVVAASGGGGHSEKMRAAFPMRALLFR